MGKQKRWRRSYEWATHCCIRNAEPDDQGRPEYCEPEDSENVMRSPNQEEEQDQSRIEVAVEASEELCIQEESLTKKPCSSFVGELPVTMTAGCSLIVDGRVKPTAMRCAVNLNCGQSSEEELAFHLNPRFQQQVVVRNSKHHEHWGREERSSWHPFPFKRGERFIVHILPTQDEFMVAINGKHFCSFTHRVPFTQIQVVQVTGDVTLNLLEYKKCGQYPITNGFEDSVQLDVSTALSTVLSTVQNNIVCKTPLIITLPNKFGCDCEVEITGAIKLLPHVFFINLQEGTQTWPHPTIPLHIKPPLGDQAPFLVCNSWSRGHWGTEEKILVHNLRPGHDFKLKIKCQNDEYVIYLNDVDTVKFKHRLPISIIDCIYVFGDVRISDVIIR